MFKDATIFQELSINGFAVLDAHLTEETEKLKEYIAQNFSIAPSEFYYSLLSNSYPDNIRLQHMIAGTLRLFYQRYFESHRILTESFLAKPANTPAEFALHQDWCYTDEREYPAYNIWIPLEDTTEENGAMIFLPGSHLWFDNLRSTTLPTARISSSYFLKQGIKAVSLKKGQVILFHPAVFHGSYPNQSSQNRIVVTATIMPAEAPFLYFEQGGTNEARALGLDDEAFLRDLHTLAMGSPHSYPEAKRIKYDHKVISEEELIERFNRQNAVISAS